MSLRTSNFTACVSCESKVSIPLVTPGVTLLSIFGSVKAAFATQCCIKILERNPKNLDASTCPLSRGHKVVINWCSDPIFYAAENLRTAISVNLELCSQPTQATRSNANCTPQEIQSKGSCTQPKIMFLS